MSRPAVRRRELSTRESGAGLWRAPGGEAARIRMSPALRAVVFSSCGLLWLSGVAWLVLHFWFPQPTPFGPLPNPWEPVLLRVHGLLAVVGVFVLGWLAADHLKERWSVGRNHRSGFMLAGTAALLVLSGYALYYSTGALHEVAARTHEGVGAASLLVALVHWWRMRP